MTLLHDVHTGLETPQINQKLCLIRGSYKYYHYKCDRLDDRGWGCGYRTLQTICSWLHQQKRSSSIAEVPSLKTIQQLLVDIGDKTQDFIGSRDWIGSVEAAFCIEKLYEVSCKIIHARSLTELTQQIDTLENHFEVYGSPVMMGGDQDNSSKGIIGVCRNSDGIFLLVLDPHNSNINASKEVLQSEGWIKWRSLSSFDQTSFYNLCCPLFRACNY